MPLPADTLQYAYCHAVHVDADAGLYVVTGGRLDGHIAYDDRAANDRAWIEPGARLVARHRDLDWEEEMVGHTADGDLVTRFGGQTWLQTNQGELLPGDVGAVFAGHPVFCLARDTALWTPEGPRPIQDLAPGDAVLTLSGAAVPVRWIGRKTLQPFMARIGGHLPVCIRAGALAENVPARDLCVSPDHALLVGGCLVQAGALVNGRSIRQLTAWSGEVAYYTVETERHEIVLAEGAPVETFIHQASRAHFDNHAEYAALYPGAGGNRPMREIALPRLRFGRQLSMGMRRRLGARADRLALQDMQQALERKAA